MRAALLGCWVCAAIAGEAWAHRLDEYLQATRITVATNRIEVSLELTPGVAVANQVLAWIDRDRDGNVSKEEGAAYAEVVLKDIRLGLDRKNLALSAGEVSVPSIEEVRSGLGVMRIKATASPGSLAAGPHVLTLTNVHLPAISVYLVNAVQPRDARVEIGRQTRDELQRGYRLEFEVRPERR